MIVLIAGASHTGKTLLAQRMLEKYGYPYLSIDHLKMGLIRSQNTNLTPISSDKELIEYLWPIVREIIKTAIENQQNLIVEGCYIPFDWKKDFSEEYLCHIRYYCLIMSKSYIETYYDDIFLYENVIESRLRSEREPLQALIQENARNLKMCKQYHLDYLLIDNNYSVWIDL